MKQILKMGRVCFYRPCPLPHYKKIFLKVVQNFCNKAKYLKYLLYTVYIRAIIFSIFINVESFIKLLPKVHLAICHISGH